MPVKKRVQELVPFGHQKMAVVKISYFRGLLAHIKVVFDVSYSRDYQTKTPLGISSLFQAIGVNAYILTLFKIQRVTKKTTISIWSMQDFNIQWLRILGAEVWL